MKLTKRELEAYCSDISQVMGIQECVLQGGKAKGTNAYIVNNGHGLEMTVLKDKCFTISKLSFHGTNMGFLSKAGVCGPEFFQEDGSRGFLRNFEAGFLTTCGLTYMGTAGEEAGHVNGLHGVISNTPIEHASANVEWKDDVAWMTLKGHAKEGHLYGPNLEIRREFSLNSEENKLMIFDQIENHGFEEAPLMLLYHFNLGYPMLDGSCRIYSNFDQIEARDDYSAIDMDKQNVFLEPKPEAIEKVYFKTMSDKSKEDGFTFVHNQNLDMGVLLKFNPLQLPILNQWNSPKSGDYGLGLEPGTGHVGGRERVEAEGNLQFIQPGEVRDMVIEVEFFDHVSANEKLKAFMI